MSTKTRKTTAADKEKEAEAALALNGLETGSSPLPESENLERIRNILFGAQSREYEKRFSRLEAHFKREFDALRESNRRRLDDLEGFVKTETESLSNRLTTEQRQREEALTETGQVIQKNAKTARTSLQQLEDKLLAAERTLRASLLDQRNALTDEIQRKHDAVVEMLTEANDALRDEKTDRLALADLFEEVSARLRGEFNLPLDG